MKGASVCLALAVCSSCGGDGPALPDGRPDAFVFRPIDARTPGGSVELGTGTSAFEPLLTDQELGLVMGPQGGYHFILHARITEMAPGDYLNPALPENPITLFQVYTSEGRQIDLQYPPYHIGYMEDSSGPNVYVLPSGRIVQIENAEVPGVYGTRLRMVVNVWDTDGKMAWDERWVMVVPYQGSDAGP